MLDVYSLNQTVPAGSSIPLNSVSLDNCCAEDLLSPSTIRLRKAGTYKIIVNAASATAATIALTKDGSVMPGTEMTGTNPSVSKFIPVECSCCCNTSGSLIQIINPTDASETFTTVSVTVEKVR